jgi:phospholipid transport system transporter-binding protein
VSTAPAEGTANVSRRDDAIEVSGPLTFDTVPRVLSDSAAWFVPGRADVAVDLKGVGRSDSAALALLVEWLRLAKAAGRDLRLTNVPPQLRSIIRVNSLSRALGLPEADD